MRRYLQFLEDPDSLRDEVAIKQAQADLERASDPIERVKALSALERAEAVDGEVFRVGFVAHVAEWIGSADVSVSALAVYGVPAQDLVEAGLIEAAPVRRKPKVVASRGRSPRMDPSEVAALLVKGVKYRLADIAQLIDREPATARNYVNRLIEEGVVEDLGDDPDHAGKGKAPHIYRLAR